MLRSLLLTKKLVTLNFTFISFNRQIIFPVFLSEIKYSKVIFKRKKRFYFSKNVLPTKKFTHKTRKSFLTYKNIKLNLFHNE